MMGKKLLLEIREDQKEIKKLLDPTVLEKARKYDELMGYLKDIKFSVAKVSQSTDENGYEQVIVNYAPITEKIIVEINGKTETSPRFKAINFLNFLPMADMKKISVAIEKAKSVK